MLYSCIVKLLKTNIMDRNYDFEILRTYKDVYLGINLTINDYDINSLYFKVDLNIVTNFVEGLSWGMCNKLVPKFILTKIDTPLTDKDFFKKVCDNVDGFYQDYSIYKKKKLSSALLDLILSMFNEPFLFCYGPFDFESEFSDDVPVFNVNFWISSSN